MDIILELDKEQYKCIQVLKNYNLKYKTPNLKQIYVIYDYLTEQLKNESNEVVKMQLREDIEILMEYLS